MELDPVEVLNHLEALGYDQIEPHLLEKFMKGMNFYKCVKFLFYISSQKIMFTYIS